MCCDKNFYTHKKSFVFIQHSNRYVAKAGLQFHNHIRHLLKEGPTWQEQDGWCFHWEAEYWHNQSQWQSVRAQLLGKCHQSNGQLCSTYQLLVHQVSHTSILFYFGVLSHVILSSETASKSTNSGSCIPVLSTNHTYLSNIYFPVLIRWWSMPLALQPFCWLSSPLPLTLPRPLLIQH